jgi:thiol-disulfide isomerase/thioredoxin
MRSSIKLIALAGLIGASLPSYADEPLAVGSPAPAMKVAKWVKGKPVTKFEPGKVYVVEFWATWCGPCKVSIPHLTEMAKKYKGKATFTGVSVWEERAPKDQESINKKVDAFVKDFGPKMDYNVAVDDIQGTMSKTWMEAAQQNGIPTAFVIDQSGKIVWIGHPMDHLDEVVGQVIEGKFDAKAEAERVAKLRAEQEKAMQKVSPFLNALRAGKHQEALDLMDKAFADDPSLEMNYCITKFAALTKIDADKANAYAKQLSEGILAKEPMALNSLAWSMVDDASTYKGADFGLAVNIAESAVKQIKEFDTEMLAMALDTLAYAHFKNGNLKAAISNQERAVKLAAATKNFDAATKKELDDRLAMYKSKGG